MKQTSASALGESVRMTEKKSVSYSKKYFMSEKLDKSVQKRKNGGPDSKSEREKRREHV